jgi:two-component system response regulator NreC
MTEAGPSSPLQVFLLEDHVVVRQGLRHLLEHQVGIAVCGEAASIAEAAAHPAEPDVVLVDLVLPDGKGHEVVSSVRQRWPSAALLVLTMLDNPTEVRLSLEAGAAGYLLKEAAADEVVEAIRRLGRGELYLQPSLGAALTRLRDPLGRARFGSIEALTVRERDVLRLLALGHTNAEVGRSLGVAIRTVEAHRSHIVQKLGLHTRAELVRFAIDEGLVDVG